MTVATESRCCNCEASAGRLDEKGWCEQCVLDLSLEAGLLANVEELIAEWLCRGYQRDHLLAAVELSLADAGGPIAGGLLIREPVDTLERGDWHPASSAFDSDSREHRNRIALLRHMARLSIEAVAKKVGVPVEEVALWEQDVLPAEEHAAAAAAMCALFCASPAFVFGLEGEVA